MTPRRFAAFLPAVLCMAVIFWISSQPAEQLSRASQPIYDNVQRITVGESVKIVWPKVGHIVGYSALGAALLFGFGPGKRLSFFQSLGSTVLYAISDEIHQMFSAGRTASIRDVLLDTTAATLAMLLFLLFLWIIKASRLSRVRV